MTTPLQQAAQAAIANSDEFYALYKRTVTSGCIPVCELKFVAAQKELRKALDDDLAQSVEPEVLMVDAAMVEMKNIVPPLRRSECLRLIRAAINATAHPPQPQATTPLVSFAWVVLDEDGIPAYCAQSRQLCNDHINEAISEYDIEEARKWVICEAYKKQGEKP